VSADEIRDLQERVALVDTLVEEPGWGVLWDRAFASMQRRHARILGGYCDDHEEYVKEVAWLEGVDYVRKLPGQMKEELAKVLAAQQESQMEDEEELWQEAST
jgi:hypothetical protein